MTFICAGEVLATRLIVGKFYAEHKFIGLGR